MIFRFLGCSSSAMLVLTVFVCLGAAQPRAAGPSGNWQVVLAAGDNSEPVFDNATREMAGALSPPAFRRATSTG